MENLISSAKEMLANNGELVDIYARRYGCAIPSSAIDGLKKAVEALEVSEQIGRFEAVNRFHTAGWNLTHFGHYCPAGSHCLPSMLEAAKVARR